MTFAAGALGITKLLFRPGDRRRDLHDLLRSQAELSVPHQRVTLRTEDGVTIQAIHIATQHEKVIIVCHGAARNKDILSIVMLNEVLARHYDVVAFDFRGHQESGGYFTGDGKSKYDLKAAIEFVKQQGYQKIGVVGWSFGAWTAIVQAAEFHNCDSVIAAAAPPGPLRNAVQGKLLYSVGYQFWALPLLMIVTVIRAIRVKKYAHDFSVREDVARVAPIPLLMVYNEYDTAIGMPQEKFVEFFNLANEPKKLVILPGRGHIFDWPNMFDYFRIVLDWFAKTL